MRLHFLPHCHRELSQKSGFWISLPENAASIKRQPSYLPSSRPPIGRLPRIARYMALAIYYEDLIRKGRVHEYAEIATLGHVTRARVNQIKVTKQSDSSSVAAG